MVQGIVRSAGCPVRLHLTFVAPSDRSVPDCSSPSSTRRAYHPLCIPVTRSAAPQFLSANSRSRRSGGSASTWIIHHVDYPQVGHVYPVNQLYSITINCYFSNTYSYPRQAGYSDVAAFGARRTSTTRTRVPSSTRASSPRFSKKRLFYQPYNSK